MLKRNNRACTFAKPLTVTEALQSLALPRVGLRGVLEQPSTPPGYATAQRRVSVRIYSIASWSPAQL